jgi:TetR/AcrR family transcriptional regulator, regulator of biofilm formation and stress response
VAQYELYLHASRSPQIRQITDAVLAAYERMAEAALRSAGVTRPAEFARWFTCIVDGYLLQSLARSDGRDVDGLRSAIQALFTACRKRSK